MRNSAEDYIKKFEMIQHPEGGWFKETYRSKGMISAAALPTDFDGDRNFATSIYFLLQKGDISAFHRIKSDELWHFHDGDGLIVHELKTNGEYVKHLLGLDLESGQQPQAMIEAGCWFGSEVIEGGTFSLVGCTVSPGFDFQDFELAKADDLGSAFPEHYKLISRMSIQ